MGPSDEESESRQERWQMVTPLTITASWISEYLLNLASGKSDENSREIANLKHPTKGKEYSRLKISTGDLTIPIEGGAKQLKRRDSLPTLSEHGKWRREHLGAINAAYGRTPYYEHLMPEISAAYENSEGISLEEFNDRLLRVATRWIDKEAIRAEGAKIEAIRKEIRAKVDSEISIFDALFRLGREASWIIGRGWHGTNEEETIDKAITFDNDADNHSTDDAC